MRAELEKQISQTVKNLYGVDKKVELSRPEPRHGDYTTNVALQLAGKLNKSPKGIAQALVDKLNGETKDTIKGITVAGPGFINLTLSDQALMRSLEEKPPQSLNGQVIVCEYSDPNPFKILHVGHVYTTVVGDAIANLLQNAGGQVHRVNYGGDVGLHVGKTMWAILKRLRGENPDKLADVPESERSAWLAEAYVEGNKAYEESEETKQQIVELNKRVYQLHANKDKESNFAKIYWTCRTWSYEAFDAFYQRLGTKMERYYPESEVADEGLRLVNEQIGKVFEKSDGAVIFKGETHDLHTRVFINREGLPTYEAKEVGLIVRKHEDYNYDRSIVITANEQEQYMAVTLKAIEQFMPELAKATTYMPHGMVRLAGGKMSSRLGNIVTATEVLDMTAEANKAMHGKDDEIASIGAIKYAFLKSRIGGDITYDPKESVSLEGNSGPYLQYAHARAKSILSKAGEISPRLPEDVKLEESERTLAQKLSTFSEVIDAATNELMPHYVCTYLYELAQVFNRFYESAKVIGDERQDLRLSLVNIYADRLCQGLTMLGIAAPDKM
jgi:arginyl-tRNA synthetase